MFGTALGGRLQTIRRSDVGFFLAACFFFFPLLTPLSRTSLKNVFLSQRIGASEGEPDPRSQPSVSKC